MGNCECLESSEAARRERGGETITKATYAHVNTEGKVRQLTPAGKAESL